MDLRGASQPNTQRAKTRGALGRGFAAASVALSVSLIGLWAQPAAAPVVDVTGGNVRGVLASEGGAVFKGIPYAQPPIGDRRWREPQPVVPWRGVRDATNFGAICPQNPSGTVPDATAIISEDACS
jgi:para-nitrobenzyl esterase